MAQCSVDECETITFRNGMCAKHNSRVRRHGHTNVTRTYVQGKSAADRVEYVREYKLSHGCADCGYRAHHVALDFDHLPGTTKVRDIKRGQQLGWVALLEEIAKCEVVCANCHRVRTHARRGVTVEGGDDDG